MARSKITQTLSCVRYTAALRNQSLRMVIVFCHRMGDLARSFSSVVRMECILSVGAVDSVDKVLLHGAAMGGNTSKNTPNFKTPQKSQLYITRRE